MTLLEVKKLKRIEGLVEVVIQWFTGNNWWTQQNPPYREEEKQVKSWHKKVSQGCN